MEQLRAAIAARPPLTSLLQEAARLQACAKCCLRLAAVRDPVAYGSSTQLPPTAAGLLIQLGIEGSDAVLTAKELVRRADAGHEEAALAEAPTAAAAAAEGSKRRRLDPAGALPLATNVQAVSSGSQTISLADRIALPSVDAGGSGMLGGSEVGQQQASEADADAAALPQPSAAAAAAPGPVAAVVCPLCLGLLQSYDAVGADSGSSGGTGGASLACTFQLITTVSSPSYTVPPHSGMSMIEVAAAAAGAQPGAVPAGPAVGGPGAGPNTRGAAPTSIGATAAAAAAGAAEAGAGAATEETAAAGAAAAGAVEMAAADAECADRGGPPAIQQRCCAVPSLVAAAAGIAAEYEFDCFGLEVSLPASLAVRQQALSWRLRQMGLAAAAGALAAAVDVKEAVRLCYTAALAAALGRRHDPQAALRISLAATHPDAAAECSWLAAGGGGVRQRRGRQRHRHQQDQNHQQQQKQQQQGAACQLAPALTDTLVQRLASVAQADFARDCPVVAAKLVPPVAAAVVRVQAHRRPLHVGGRYLKMRRGIPQSPWFIDGRRKGESSVQEAIERAVLPAFQADSCTLVTAGREDADVRMLGSGRPFILEIQNARRSMPPPEQLQRMEAAVLEGSNRGVAVRGLHAASAAQLARLKEGEQEKEKSYVAVCWLPRALSDVDVALLESMRGLEVQQQTPIRVLHRRANLTRPKVVHEMHAVRLLGPAPPNYFALRLRTQAGTYVKEFVHGDLGRSRPSLGDLLGCKAQIISLDVSEIHMEFGGDDERHA